MAEIEFDIEGNKYKNKNSNNNTNMINFILKKGILKKQEHAIALLIFIVLLSTVFSIFNYQKSILKPAKLDKEYIKN